MNPTITMSQINALKLMLRDLVDEDEQLWIDSIEGETNAFELVGKALDAIEQEEGVQAALTEQMATRKDRRDRSEARAEGYRQTIAAIMECAKLTKMPLPEATLSLRTLPASVQVTNKEAVPEEYTVSKPAPNIKAIKEAFDPEGQLPNWLARVEPRPSLTIRRK